MFTERATQVAEWLTTPLLPDDYLRYVNPLWSARQPRGRVESVRRETADTTTLLIRPGRGWRTHRAGQFLGLGVEIDGVHHWRTYSISSAPGRPDGRVAVTVTAIAGGLVSNHLAHGVAPGAIVLLAPPDGAFVLPDERPEKLLFVTAGSGITPVMAILRDLADRGERVDVRLVHSAATRDAVIFGAELDGLAERLPELSLHVHLTRDAAAPAPRLTGDALAALCPDWAERETWACGPAGLLDALDEHLTAAGRADALHVERFAVGVAGGGGEGGTVAFSRTGREVDVAGDVSLLDAGEGAGVLMPSGCRMGICHTCVARLCSGQVRDLRTGEVHGAAGDRIQTCVSAPAGPLEIDL